MGCWKQSTIIALFENCTIPLIPCHLIKKTGGRAGGIARMVEHLPSKYEEREREKTLFKRSSLYVF
jgi:hypothetical protein